MKNLCTLAAASLALLFVPLSRPAVAADPPPPAAGGSFDLEQLLAGRPVINGPLTLNGAVAIARRESPLVRGAVAEVDAAVGRFNAARAQRRPMLSANTFASGGSLPNIVESPKAVQPSMIMGLPHGAFVDQNLMLMYPLFTGGRLQAMVRQAAALRRASEIDVETQRQEVALMTRTAYHDVLARQAMVGVSQTHLEQDQEQLRIDRALADEGKVPAFTVQREEAQVAATQQDLTNAARDVELSLVQLKTVMGVHPGSDLHLVEALDDHPSATLLQSLTGIRIIVAVPTDTARRALPSDLAALLRLAQKRRPELQVASRRILAAEADAAATDAGYRPQVNLFAMGDVMKMRTSKSTAGTTFGVVASIPLLTGGEHGARHAIAQAEVRKQGIERERVGLQIAQEVSNSLLNLRAAEQNIQTARSAQTAAAEDYRVARLRYEAGKSIAVELLDALTARVRAESNVVQALYSYNVARDQLLRAVGAL